MAKKQKDLNKKGNEITEHVDFEGKQNTETVKKNKSKEITKTFTRHAWPREVIEHVKHKLYPIQSGVIRFFNPTKGKWFITPNDWSNDIYIQDFERTFKDWEKVNYMEINHEALPTSKWQIRMKTKHAGEFADRIFIIVTPDENNKKTVELRMEPIFPHNKVEGHGNVADKSRPEYPIDISSFDTWDDVDFVANKKWIIVAIKKTEK